MNSPDRVRGAVTSLVVMLVFVAVITALRLSGCMPTEPTKPLPTEATIHAWVEYDCNGKHYRVEAEPVTVLIRRGQRADVTFGVEFTKGEMNGRRSDD